jgi:hypothetical protein
VPSLTQCTGFEAAKEKEEMDDTEAFITHSDHLAKGDSKDSEKEKQYYLTGLQPNRMVFKDKLDVQNCFTAEEHPMTERPGERASIDSLYSANNNVRYP